MSNEKSVMHTFVVYVENKPGVLTRVSSLFRRRASRRCGRGCAGSHRPGYRAANLRSPPDRGCGDERGPR